MANENEQVAYFYCSKKQGQPDGSEPVQILRGLTHQLAWSPQDSVIANPIKVLWNNGRRSKETKLSLNECCSMLHELTGRCQRTTIIIDALDECADPNDLLERLKSLARWDTVLSLFVSSRNEVNVIQVLEGCSIMSLGSEDLVSEDMEYFIRHEVQDKRPHARLLAGRYPELESRLTDVLSRCAQGS